MSRRRKRSLKARVGQKGARLDSGGIQAGGVRGGSHSVGRCGVSSRSRDATGGQLQQ